MISLRLGLTENPRGPGLWKLNTSFLTEEEYINRIKTVILKTREDYKDDNDVKESSTFLWKKKLRLAERTKPNIRIRLLKWRGTISLTLKDELEQQSTK